ncbi:hypothetical protein GBW32_15625 [Streptomyces tsukubensis]|uniref:hypothetical protein n=1 Tax=Streptomyces tsukubensis TaxID=83656 RepID=UPI001265DB9F|nr:hypothetical protein [Streptomyces tsukubensis]QFR94225.1 hypothetical protein GBW32_15625 [Streptomyces tsukubensis]
MEALRAIQQLEALRAIQRLEALRAIQQLEALRAIQGRSVAGSPGAVRRSVAFPTARARPSRALQGLSGGPGRAPPVGPARRGLSRGCPAVRVPPLGPVRRAHGPSAALLGR